MCPSKINIFIEKAKKGNQTAFTFLHDHYKSEVYCFIFKYSKNKIIANDVTNDAFSKAFTKIGTYRPEYQFNTWLNTIAKNGYFTLYRKKRLKQIINISTNDYEFSNNIADSSKTKEEEMVTNENETSLIKTIQQLKPSYKKVIQLYYYEDMSYAQIALLLGISIDSVKSNLHRAKLKMKQIINATN